MVNAKRKIALAASCIAALMAMAACSSGTSSTAPASTEASASSDNGTSTAATSTAAASSSLAPYQLVWYMEANAQPPATARVVAAVNQMLKPINATLQFNIITWSDWATKVPAMMASSQPFDIVFTANWNNYMTQAQQGSIIKVDDLMQQYGQNVISDCGQDLLNTIKVTGPTGTGMYAVPTNKDNFCAFGYVFNEKILKEHNWDPTTIKTWSDVTPWLAAVKADPADKGIIPLAAGANNFTYMGAYDNADVAGNSYIPLGMKFDATASGAQDVTYYLDDPQYLTILKMWRSWFQNGYVPPDAALATSTTVTNAQVNGTAFCWPVQLKPGKAGELSNAKVTYVQQLLTDYYLQSGMGSMQAISKTSKDPARAMMFLNMLYGEDSKKQDSLLNLLTWGQEGQDYTLTSAGQVSPVSNPGWNLQMQWGFGNQLNQMTAITQPADEYTQIAQVNQTCKKMYCSGFVFDPTKVQTQYTAVANAVKPLMDPMSVGALDPTTTLPQIKSAAMGAGLQAVWDELKTQVAAHIAANPMS